MSAASLSFVKVLIHAGDLMEYALVLTHLVTLNILSSRRARSTLMPNDAPGLIISQITSQMLPTIT